MKLLLCDAVVIIESFKLNIWKLLTSKYRIFISSAVLKESQYFKDELSQKRFLDLTGDIANSKMIKITIPLEDIQPISQKAMVSRIDIHIGEAESITAMLEPEYQDLDFCTADKTAVIAAHLFDLLGRVVSLEKCLGKQSPPLPQNLTENVMQKWKAEAIQRVKK